MCKLWPSRRDYWVLCTCIWMLERPEDVGTVLCTSGEVCCGQREVAIVVLGL